MHIQGAVLTGSFRFMFSFFVTVHVCAVASVL